MDVVITINTFINQLRAKGYADSTITSYTQNLTYFTRYLLKCDLTNLKKVTHKVIVEFHEKVMEESIAMESKALKIRPVKRLFEYLTDNHLLLVNPTDGIVETCRKNRKIGPVLTVKEIKNLFDQPDLTRKTGLRNRAIMELLYSSGIRINELLSLTIYDADLKESVLFIRKGKGARERVVPVGKRAGRYLNTYIQEVRPIYTGKNPTERALFVNRFGHALSGGSIRAFLRNYRISARIEKPISPHTFRRTCATHLLQEGVDIRYIQKLLGHKWLSTTQMYTKVMPIEVKQTHERTHPRL